MPSSRRCRARSSAATPRRLRETELALARRRQVLELHDGVVQGLAVAHLALELDRTDESREAMLGALENARAIVGRSIDELRSEAIRSQQLLEDAAPGER